MNVSVKKSCFLGILVLPLAIALIFVSSPFQNIHAQAGSAAIHTSVARQKSVVRKMIVVNLSQQWLYAYQNGQQVFDTAVTTGRPGLRTPTGTYSIFAKFSPKTFHSPWPRSSPNWYPPTKVKYALEWKADGYFLHDSWWQSVFGPDTNGQHYDPVYGWEKGSHGCITMPTSAAAWLYNWAPLGTKVQILP